MTQDGQRYRGARWTAWLYERHSEAELQGWIQRLRWFRYCRAVGGHANDCDELRLALRAETEHELLALFVALGITPEWIPDDAPQPVPGVAYTPGEYARFPSRIPEFPGLAQPGHLAITGEKAFAWASSGRLALSLSDPDTVYEVTERAVAAAVAIESALADLSAAIIDPPLDDPHCLCPKYYPHLWPAP
ncbi:hypothetical protein AB0N05_02625 [Nocardia sp. NPDC051030]|uniref:hypothetical protein n=1 Tax=Nocardia sp. NPDC051030 TaxID=3155162 RepID=UPI0034497E82